MTESNTEQRIEGMAIEGKSVMLRDAKGHFLPGQEPPNIIRSSEQAAGLAKRRWEVAKAKARRAMADAYREHTGKQGATPTDAYAGMADEFARSAYANAMDKPREAVEAGKFALRLADMLPAADQQAQSGARVTLELAPDVAAAALALLASRRTGEAGGE